MAGERQCLGVAAINGRFVERYRETAADVSPEGLKGEMPAIGFRLAQWSQVERGAHQFAALAYALPADFDLATFSALRATRVVVEATEMRHP